MQVYYLYFSFIIKTSLLRELFTNQFSGFGEIILKNFVMILLANKSII